ncbi:sensor histidine kinase [Bifidobacterium choloepi]|uniref:Sensor-like histidine kinase SenX3 n=1 Tax=Bifidobacterium choloepi TaxID=2614131 RepID=A0A6I5N701_9BIFI|nr:ATP-binding protein [Bifidobacterium choloepi]NEG69581.1 ATPase [Bifidobacterium choloepi]
MVALNASTFIFAAFFLLALGAVIGLLVFVYGLVEPWLSRLFGGASVRDTVDGWFSRRRRRLHAGDDDDDDDSDDLDDSTATLLSMLPAAAVVVDDDDEVVRANPEAYRLGVVVDDAIGIPAIREAVGKVRAKGGRMMLDVTTDTPEVFAHTADDGHVEKTAVAPDDDQSTVSRPNWLKVTVGRINEQFVVVLLDDVSESIRFQQTRDDFIENVSRQLLKPGDELNRLADTLEAGHLSEEEVATDAREVRRATLHVEHMVADLLMLIRAQEPVSPSDANRINVMAQVRAAIDGTLVAHAAAERNISIHVSGDDSLEIHGEPSQIRTALGKMLDNAVVYSPDGATVSVVVSKSRHGHDAVIRILDRGVGIPADEQGRIFERFFRGSNQSERTSDGVGLGLAIVKHVALTHHGTVTVWSRPGQGTTFTLLLPLAK